MGIILGLSGKKQSGKNTCLNWLMGNHMVGLGLVDWVKISDKGQLLVPAQVGDEIQEGVFDVDNPAAAEYLEKYVWPFVKQYSCADELKGICMRVFGLSYAQVYGTNAEKQTPTQLRWEDMPGITTNEQWHKIACGEGLLNDEPEDIVHYHAAGVMTGRDVMQYFGTDICRKMWDTCWIDATIRKIMAEQSQLAIITDVRFPNEVLGIQAAGGKVLRFTRDPFAGGDRHYSETALDGYAGFDGVIDNGAMNIPEQNKAVTELLIDWGFVKMEFEETA